jgi:hypothetical protein
MCLEPISTPAYQMLLWEITYITFICNMVKGKAIPLQAWTGPEGSRRLRLPDF